MKFWKSIIALSLLPIAFLLDLVNFYFSILFLVWSIRGIKSKVATFLDDIPRSKNPILFWIVSITWVVLSLLSLVYSEPFVEYLLL